MNLLLILIPVKFSDGSDLLGCEENTDLIAEQVEKMWVEDSRVFWIELLNEFIKCVEVLNFFSEHLLLDLVEDLVWLIFPVHFNECLIGK